jgi:hypothetical protein
MDLKWPSMITVRKGSGTHTAGERLYWPDYHLSLVVPPFCSALTNEASAYVTSGPPVLAATLEHHDSGDWLVSTWMDEGFSQDREELKPAGALETVLGVVSRRFTSQTMSGFKARSDDVYRNGVSGRLFGPKEHAANLSTFKEAIFASVRFVHQGVLTEEQVRKAVVGFVNVEAGTIGDLYRYLDRHFYVMRDDVMEVFGTFTRQVEKEGHPGAARATACWDVLQKARRAADEGTWDRTLAGVRGSGG